MLFLFLRLANTNTNASSLNHTLFQEPALFATKGNSYLKWDSIDDTTFSLLLRVVGFGVARVNMLNGFILLTKESMI